MSFLKKKDTWLGFLLAAIIAELLHALLVRFPPYLGALLSRLVSVITFGSAWVRDTPYRSAALDSYPLTALILLALAVLLPLTGAVGKLHIDNMRFAREIPSANGEMRWFVRAARITYIITIALGSLAALSMIVGTFMLSEAVYAKRAFEANLTILDPQISDQQHKVLRAEFASMQGQADFAKLADEMQTIAKAHGVALRPESKGLLDR